MDDVIDRLGRRSQPMYERLLRELRKAHPEPAKIQDGVFGAMMSVSIENDGPVTIQLDSRKFTYDAPKTHPHISGGVERKTGQGSTREPKPKARPAHQLADGGDVTAAATVMEEMSLADEDQSDKGSRVEDDMQSIYSTASAP